MGVSVGGAQQKICAYADDILITLTQPETSLLRVLSILERVCSYSGYRLNLHKTQILTFNYKPSGVISRKCQFNWKNNVIKYLGVQIPRDLTSIYDKNYNPITVESKQT